MLRWALCRLGRHRAVSRLDDQIHSRIYIRECAYCETLLDVRDAEPA